MLPGVRMAADILIKSKNPSIANQGAANNQPVLCDLVKCGMSQGCLHLRRRMQDVPG